MSLISLERVAVGRVGVKPGQVSMISTDNLSTVTTAGYLAYGTNSKAYSIGLSPSDIVECLYSYNTATNTGSAVWFQVAISNGQITLTSIVDAGNVLLPVVANDFANFSGTTGLIADAGYSPSDATKTKVVMASAATISGQLAQFNDTAGTIGDSGVTTASVSTAITQLGTLHSATVTLNQTQMAAAYATPATLIANPLASQMILILSGTVYTASTGNTAYATGTAPIIQYSSGGTNGAHGTGTIATATGLVAGDITAATSQVRNLFEFATGAQTGLSGLGVYFSNATGAYTGGTGTNVTFNLIYTLLTATV